MIPKYPFCVSVWRKVGSKLDQRLKSFETLTAAADYANASLRSIDVKRVQLYCILDDCSRNEMGQVVFFDREATR